MNVLNWIVDSKRPFNIILTKIDKIDQSELAEHIKILEQTGVLRENIFPISSIKGKGIKQLEVMINAQFL